VKKALKRKEEIDAAIAEWVLNNPPPMDTVYVPGDTITRADTLTEVVIDTDTVRTKDTVRITQTKWREVRYEVKVVDTIKVEFVDDRAERVLKSENDRLEGRMEEMRKEAKTKVWWLSGLAAALGITAGMMLKRGFR
jgi:hypothetical protein